MAEETLTEALANLNDENIEKASLPEHRRVEEEVSEDVAIIDLDDSDIEDDIENDIESMIDKSISDEINIKSVTDESFDFEYSLENVNEHQLPLGKLNISDSKIIGKGKTTIIESNKVLSLSIAGQSP